MNTIAKLSLLGAVFATSCMPMPVPAYAKETLAGAKDRPSKKAEGVTPSSVPETKIQYPPFNPRFPHPLNPQVKAKISGPYDGVGR